MPSERYVHVVVEEPGERHKITRLLQAEGCQIEAHVSGPAFLTTLPRAPSGCVLLNTQMSSVNGIEVLRRMGLARTRLAVIVLDGHDLPLAVEAMKAGAVEFLEKPYTRDTLLAALDVGFAQLETVTAADAARDAARKAVARLTPREQEVLRGLLAGQRNKAIARQLDVSHRTVELHRANMMGKLGAQGVSAAVRIALAAGLAPAE